ncbi:hypothetical protein BGZ93_003571, partial [Podila epicladia]
MSEPENSIRDTSPATSSVSGVIPYSDRNTLDHVQYFEQMKMDMEKMTASVTTLASEMRRLARSVDPNFE